MRSAYKELKEQCFILKRDFGSIQLAKNLVSQMENSIVDHEILMEKCIQDTEFLEDKQ